MPNMDSAITSTKPNAPPKMVNSVRRRPCSTPCVNASKPLGPGDSDKADGGQQINEPGVECHNDQKTSVSTSLLACAL